MAIEQPDADVSRRVARDALASQAVDFFSL